jgi:digeranylgeranylglycerophospholipid reductase
VIPLLKEYGVCIIGGGPAGLWAAKSLAKHGLTVLILERKKNIGFPVICGEFIPSKEEAHRLLPCSKLVAEFYRFLPQEYITNKTKAIRVYSPSGHIAEFNFEGLVIDRNLLEQFYAEKIKELDGKILTSAIALKGFYKGESIALKFKVNNSIKKALTSFLIGADGFPSKVAKWFGLNSGYNKEEDEALCLNSVFKSLNIEEDIVEIYTGRMIAPGGYAWIIPKAEGIANVGLGIRQRWASHHSIKDYFKHFIANHPIASNKLSKGVIQSIFGKTIPVGGLVKELACKHVVLAGDAAGLVIPINGSGILTAAISGILAGEAIWEETIGKGGVDSYKSKLLSEIGDALEKGLLYRRFIDSLISFDNLFNFSFFLAGKSIISSILLCQKSKVYTILKFLYQPFLE